MIDLHNNQNLGYIINHFHRHNKPTGLICHGPVALLSTNLAISMGLCNPLSLAKKMLLLRMCELTQAVVSCRPELAVHWLQNDCLL